MSRQKLPLPRLNDNRVKPDGLSVEKSGTIYNAATNTIHINDVIDDWFGINAADVSDAINAMDDAKDLRVVINSPGGSVYDAIAIHNMIAEWPGTVTTHVTSIAASAATLIAMVGDERTIADNAEYMVHNPWMYVAGNAVELRSYADKLDKTSEKLLDMYERKSSLSRDEITSLLDGEDGEDGTYMTAQESLDAGFSTEIIDTSRQEDTESAVTPRLVSAKIKLSAIDI